MIVATGYHVSVATYDIGVCYGMQGNALPSATDVISMYTKYGIEKLRLFDPVPAALEALKGSKIQVVLGLVMRRFPASTLLLQCRISELCAVLDANKMVGIEVTTVVSAATLGTSYPLPMVYSLPKWPMK
ncbi:hypothetical protein HHK36_025416 [Tetracentron sinense]|uniref:Glucan endo-1,3-beta-D-glucosidase n=1 Tax=Tetracentron sinense TaxID=13715 RepID=A0A834YKE3_TETSI|nr:hypothetical protein HHK36_025416 [Tetracentron sinense]